MNEVSIATVLKAALGAKRGDITAAVYSWARGKVQTGPFKGMRILQASSWGDGDLCPKILGAYEAELHSCLDIWAKAPPETVINVGCAEGYYAVGLTRLFPGAVTRAFDISQTAQDICHRNAALNQVQERLIVGGLCTQETLREILTTSGRTVIVCDCEGGELELLNPAVLPDLCRCDILVECHDFVNRSISPTLLERFKVSHRIDVIPEGPRDPNRFALLRRMPSLDRWLAVCEFRPEFMTWMFMRPKSPATARPCSEEGTV